MVVEKSRAVTACEILVELVGIVFVEATESAEPDMPLRVLAYGVDELGVSLSLPESLCPGTAHPGKRRHSMAASLFNGFIRLVRLRTNLSIAAHSQSPL